jgi:hypothetical protein
MFFQAEQATALAGGRSAGTEQLLCDRKSAAARAGNLIGAASLPNGDGQAKGPC